MGWGGVGCPGLAHPDAPPPQPPPPPRLSTPEQALKAYHKCVSDPSRVKDYIDQPELYNFLCRILSR